MNNITKNSTDLYRYCSLQLVGTMRFELMVSCSQSRRDNQASLRPDASIFSSSVCLVSRKRLKPRRERNKIVGLRELSTAPVAQLDRVPDYESGGYRFESCRARQSANPIE